jgi:hypothetical protein
MGGCAAYLHLVETPSPEIMAFMAYWAAATNHVEDIGIEARELARGLLGMTTAERLLACQQFIASQKMEDKKQERIANAPGEQEAGSLK